MPEGSTSSETQRKVWFITGTSTGFGKRLVSIVLSRGDYVIATVRRTEDFQVPVSEPDLARLRVVILDMRDTVQEIQNTVNEALVYWGRIDVLVNNAGWAPKSLIEEAGTNYTLSVFQTNVFGTLNVTNAVLPNMRERRSGTVVFIGSRSVWKPDTPLTGHYIATKAAIHTFAETYASELAPFGVRVLIAVPGGFRTENIHTVPILSEHRIPEYDGFRQDELRKFHERWRSAPGDPVKAMEVLVDVVNQEGKAEGRELPQYLVLGSPTFVAGRSHCERLMLDMDSWEDIAMDLDHDIPT